MKKNFEKLGETEEGSGIGGEREEKVGKTKETEENTEKPEGAEELEGVKVEKEESPMKKLERKDEAELIKEYLERFEISEEAKETIDGYLSQEAEEEKFKFAREWFEDHKDELEEHGYDIKSEDDIYIRTAVIEQGGFEELEKNEEYEETEDEIENVYALKVELKEKTVSIQSQHLILNRLNKRGERIEKEFKEAEKRGDEATMKSKDIEFNSLFKVKKELGEKLSGRNLKEEAVRKGKLGLLETEDEYVDKNVSPKLEEIEKNLLKKGEAKEKVIKTFSQELGYDREEKGILRKKIVIKKEGEVIGEFRGNEKLGEFLREKMREKIEKEFKEEWAEKNNDREVKIYKFVEEELRKLGSSPEEAVGGIESIYEEVKKRICDKADLKVRGKTAKEKREIESKFRGEGKDPTKFFDEVLNRKGSLEKLTGNWEEDKDEVVKFLEGWGVSGSEEFLEKFDKDGKEYAKVVGKKRGFLEWLIKASFNTLEQHD